MIISPTEKEKKSNRLILPAFVDSMSSDSLNRSHLSVSAVFTVCSNYLVAVIL